MRIIKSLLIFVIAFETATAFTADFSSNFVHFIGEFHLFLGRIFMKCLENVSTEIDKNTTDEKSPTTMKTTTTTIPTTATIPSSLNFNVTVKTSPVTWSGTDASVFLHLGIGNETSEYLFKDKSDKDILEHDQVDRFTFPTENDMRNLQSCSLKMKPPKCHFFHGWHVEYIKIQFGNETYFCHFWKWLHCHEQITSPAYRIK